METPGPVRTELYVLLDIRGARWTGDEIDRPRQRFRHPAGAQTVPSVLVGCDDLVSLYKNDVGVRQEIQRRRSLRPGNQHKRPGLGDRGVAACKADLVVCLGAAASNLQQSVQGMASRLGSGAITS